MYCATRHLHSVLLCLTLPLRPFRTDAFSTSVTAPSSISLIAYFPQLFVVFRSALKSGSRFFCVALYRVIFSHTTFCLSISSAVCCIFMNKEHTVTSFPGNNILYWNSLKPVLPVLRWKFQNTISFIPLATVLLTVCLKDDLSDSSTTRPCASFPPSGEQLQTSQTPF